MNRRQAISERSCVMADPFLDSVFRFIKQHDLIPEHAAVIAAFSGGADSLAMLLALAAYRDHHSFTLTAAHLNHGLRGSEADEDEVFVRQWCDKLNISCHFEKADIKQLAAEQRKGLEETGRTARYQLFDEIAQKYKRKNKQVSVRIALAHHQQDQAETLLMHLGRGSGLDGLAGMKPVNGHLIRPLLERSRGEIETFLRRQGITWREDKTNQQLIPLRNNIRHRLLPLWQDILGYDPSPRLARTAQLAADDQKLINELLHPVYQDIHTGGRLHAGKLIACSASAASHLLRRFWRERTLCEQDLSWVHVRQILDWLPGAVQGQQICLPHQWRRIFDKPYLLLEKSHSLSDAGLKALNRRTITGCDPVINCLNQGVGLTVPGITRIPDLNLKIEAVLIENEREIVYNNAMECFRLENIQHAVLRGRRSGDRIYPVSRTGGKSLKKFFNERKIKPYDRDRMPLLATGSDVMWIPGLASDQRYTVRQGCTDKGPFVCLRVHQPDSGNK